MFFKNISSFFFFFFFFLDRQFILCHMSTTVKNKVSQYLFYNSWLFIILLPSHNIFCNSLWVTCHPPFLGLKIWWRYYCAKIIFLCNSRHSHKGKPGPELAVSNVGHIRKPFHGHMASVLCIPGMADLPGRGHKLHSRGVGIPGPQSAGLVQGGDVRELQEPGLLGWGQLPSRITYLPTRFWFLHF